MTPNGSTLDRAIDGVFAVAMAAIAWLVVFGHRGVAPCVGLMALVVALRPRVWRDGLSIFSPSRIRSDPLSVAALAAAVFTVWIAITTLWSPTPGAVWLALTIAAALLSAVALAHEAATATGQRAARFAVFFALMVVAASAALLFEGLSGGYLRAVIPPDDASPFRFKDMTALGRGVTAMALVVFPAASILKRLTGSWLVALAPGAALSVAAIQFSIFTNVIALAAGAAVFLIAFSRPRSALVALVILFVAAAIATPFIAASLHVDLLVDGGAGATPASWAQRLFIWREAGARALGDCLPLGCGADYARAWAEDAAVVNVPGSPITLSVMPTHPHNLFIQLWLELGLVGVGAFCIAAATGGAALLRRRCDTRTAAAIAATLAAGFVSVMLEASLWQAWRLADFALAAFGLAVSYSVNNKKQ